MRKIQKKNCVSNSFIQIEVRKTPTERYIAFQNIIILSQYFPWKNEMISRTDIINNPIKSKFLFKLYLYPYKIILSHDNLLYYYNNITIVVFSSNYKSNTWIHFTLYNNYYALRLLLLL